MSKKKLVEDIKQSPQRFYRTPADVARDRRFSDVERLEILNAWKSLAVGEAGEQQQVVEALRDVEQKLAQVAPPFGEKQ